MTRLGLGHTSWCGSYSLACLGLFGRAGWIPLGISHSIFGTKCPCQCPTNPSGLVTGMVLTPRAPRVGEGLWREASSRSGSHPGSIPLPGLPHLFWQGTGDLTGALWELLEYLHSFKILNLQGPEDASIPGSSHPHRERWSWVGGRSMSRASSWGMMVPALWGPQLP